MYCKHNVTNDVFEYYYYNTPKEDVIAYNNATEQWLNIKNIEVRNIGENLILIFRMPQNDYLSKPYSFDLDIKPHSMLVLHTDENNKNSIGLYPEHVFNQVFSIL